MKKRLFFCILSIIFVLAICGCSMASVNEERDGKQIIATVNGEEILKGSISKRVEMSLTQYGYAETDANYSDYYNQIMEGYLEQEISYVLLSQKCDEFGIDRVTKEQQEEIDGNKKSLYDSVYSNAESKYTEEEYPDADERQKLIDAYAAEQLESSGYFDGTYEKQYYFSYLTENIREYLSKDYSPTDEEAKAFYDRELADQQDVIGTTKSKFETYEKDNILLFMPEGIRYVRNLLIAIPEDVRTQINTLRNDDDEDNDSEADVLRDEELAKIKEKADLAYVAAEQDFDAALVEYGEDPGMKEEPESKEGYRIYENMANMDSIFVNTGLELKKTGDISKPTASDFGYYIIEYTSAVESEIVSFEEAKDNIIEYMKKKHTDEEYTVNYGIWLEEADVVKYSDRF